MRVREKTALIISASILGLLGVLYASAYPLLTRSFAQAEEEATRREMARAREALAYLLDELDSLAAELAQRDDTYRFAVDGNPEYDREHLGAQAMNALKVEVLAVTAASGRLVAGRRYDAQRGLALPLGADFLEHTVRDSPLTQRPGREAPRKGLLGLGNGALLIVSRPVLTSRGEGPCHGALLLGRRLDEGLLRRLTLITGLPLRLHTFHDRAMPPDMWNARLALGLQQPDAILPLNGETICGYALLPDVYGNTVLVLRVDAPRTLTAQGRAGLLYFGAVLLALGIVFTLAAVLVMHRLVVARVGRLNAQVQSISRRADPAQRVALSGRDELAALAGELNRMLDALERAERTAASRARLALLGELAAGVAHEFRNPLHGVLNCIEMLRAKAGQEPANKELLDLAEEGLRRMNVISERLLRLGRERTMVRAPADVASLVESSLTFIRTRAEKAGVTLNVVVEPGLPPLSADATRVSEALLNLLTNALDACQPGGQVRVEARRADPPAGLLALTVSDDGVGIPAEIQGKVFEPFFTTKPAGKGSGLGLAIVRRIMEEHGGRAELESEPGRGTTVRLLLPFPG